MPEGMAGDSYRAELSVSGGKSLVTWEIADGTLPFGLRLTDAGLISGAPEQEGKSHFTIKVTEDQTKKSASRAFILTINSELEITTDLSLTGEGSPAGADFIAEFHARGGATPYAWTFNRGFAPPSWIRLERNTGRLTGAPPGPGTLRFAVQVKDAGGHIDTGNFSLKVRKKRRLWPGRGRGTRVRITRFAVSVHPAWREWLHVSSSLALLAGGLPALGALFILFYSIAAPGPALGHLGVASLTSLTAFLIGCLAGFLFGIPKTVSTGTLRQASRGTSTYSPSTNLAEVSDWLTKLLLGAGLVQLTHLGPPIGRLIDHIAAGLGSAGTTSHGDTVMAGAIVFGYAAIGLLDGYVLTTTWYQNWLTKHADQS